MRLLITLVCVLSFAGCTQDQINRAQAIDDAAHARQAQAEAALGAAQEALDVAKALAAQVGAEKASAALAKAQQALDMAGAFAGATKAAVATADATLAAAKSSAAAGGATIDTLLAVLTAFVPTAGVAAVAVMKAVRAGQAFTQTVKGIDAAKESMGPELFAKHLAPALAAAQDEHVKAKVDVVQAGA